MRKKYCLHKSFVQKGGKLKCQWCPMELTYDEYQKQFLKHDKKTGN